MSLPSRSTALAGLAAFGALVAACPAYADTTQTYTLSCDFPLVGSSEFTATVKTTIPGSYAVGQFTPSWNVDLTLTSGPGDDDPDGAYSMLRLVKATTLGGVATAPMTIDGAGFSQFEIFPELAIPDSPVPSTAPFTLHGTGMTPRIAFPRTGTARFQLERIDLNLRATKPGPVTQLSAAQGYPDSDGDPNTFDAPCTVVGTAPPVAEVTVTPPTPSPTPTCPPGLACDPTPTPDPRTPTPTPTPLWTGTPIPPSPTPSATPTPSPTPTPTVDKPTLVPTPTPLPTPKPVAYSYALAGQATLKTLTKGSLPLTGKADAALTLATGDFSAALSLNQTHGNLVALGFLPVTADVAIVPQGDATGTLSPSSGVLTVNTKVRIKLPKVTLFGLQLGGGSGCQAKNVSAITLKSPGAFDALAGGSISGTFTISDLVNCGALTGIISPLTAGSGNAIALKLTPATT